MAASEQKLTTSSDSPLINTSRSSKSLVTKDSLIVHTGEEPHIAFSRAVIDSKTDRVLRVATVEVYLEGETLSGQQRCLRGVKLKRSGHEHVLELDCSAPLVSGVDNIPEEWPEEVREQISQLCSFTDDRESRIIPLPSQDPSYFKYIEAQLRTLRGKPRKKLLSMWRDKKNLPVTEWQEMRETIGNASTDQTGLISQSSVKYCFPSLEVAEIKLCVGRYLEQQWQENVVAGISGDVEVAFMVIGVGLVVSFVKYQDREQVTKLAALDDRMTIQILQEVEFSASEVEATGQPQMKEIIASGKLVSNRLGVESDFCVLLNKPSQAIYVNASHYGSKLDFEPAEVSIEENARNAKLEVDAVRQLCKKSGNPHSSFQEMLLTENAARAPRKNFLVEDVGCTTEEIHHLIEQVIRRLEKAGKTPNPEQTEILRNAGVVVSRFKTIWGPPGTGKTTTIAALTEIYSRCPDVGVLLCAPSNGNTGRIYDSVNAWMARSSPELDAHTHKPLRVYRAILEEEHLLKTHDHLGNTSAKKLGESRALKFMKAAEKVAADAAWYQQQIEADQRKNMSDPTTGVTHAVVKAALSQDLSAFKPPKKQLYCTIRNALVQFMSGLEQLKSNP